MNRLSAAAWPASAVAFTLLAMVPSLRAQAQAACVGRTLAGTVQDSTAAVIPGATIQLDGSPAQSSQTSGSDGRFRLPCVPAGAHHLTVSAAGFVTAQQDLAARLPPDLLITLTPAQSITVQVDADNSATEPPPGGINGATLSGAQLETLADDPDDLQRELQQLAATGGGSPTGTVISVDGFQDDSPLPPKSSIARVEVNPDLFSAENRQPSYDGGHIEIFTKPARRTFTARCLPPTPRNG